MLLKLLELSKYQTHSVHSAWMKDFAYMRLLGWMTKCKLSCDLSSQAFLLS